MDVNGNYYFAADFMAEAPISVNINTYGNESDQFLSGASSSDFASGFATLGNDDLAFLASFEVPNTVPEPTSVTAIVGMAVAGLAILRRRRRRA